MGALDGCAYGQAACSAYAGISALEMMISTALET